MNEFQKFMQINGCVGYSHPTEMITEIIQRLHNCNKLSSIGLLSKFSDVKSIDSETIITNLELLFIKLKDDITLASKNHNIPSNAVIYRDFDNNGYAVTEGENPVIFITTSAMSEDIRRINALKLAKIYSEVTMGNAIDYLITLFGKDIIMKKDYDTIVSKLS